MPLKAAPQSSEQNFFHVLQTVFSPVLPFLHFDFIETKMLFV